MTLILPFAAEVKGSAGTESASGPSIFDCRVEFA
jgi:hypothetical protein